ncbi:hypothetical protein VP01_2407g1 [Puccinia sorghi]|uniref:Uncharacterized protein n=1 Tax=Puccinia sorghi TaxID=27349 RepID=A0A0L6V7C8_9BASI|nr:hypothetical protein VP01_2407g1 [Puccinia sorghi]
MFEYSFFYELAIELRSCVVSTAAPKAKQHFQNINVFCCSQELIYYINFLVADTFETLGLRILVGAGINWNLKHGVQPILSLRAWFFLSFIKSTQISRLHALQINFFNQILKQFSFGSKYLSGGAQFCTSGVEYLLVANLTISLQNLIIVSTLKVLILECSSNMDPDKAKSFEESVQKFIGFWKRLFKWKPMWFYSMREVRVDSGINPREVSDSETVRLPQRIELEIENFPFFHFLLHIVFRIKKNHTKRFSISFYAFTIHKVYSPISKRELSENSKTTRTNQNHSDHPGHTDPSLLGYFPTHQCYHLLKVSHLPSYLSYYSLFFPLELFLSFSSSFEMSSEPKESKPGSTLFYFFLKSKKFKKPNLCSSATPEAQSHNKRNLEKSEINRGSGRLTLRILAVLLCSIFIKVGGLQIEYLSKLNFELEYNSLFRKVSGSKHKYFTLHNVCNLIKPFGKAYCLSYDQPNVLRGI